MLLLGLWYGRKKPDINMFLQKSLKDIDDIQEKQGLYIFHYKLSVSQKAPDCFIHLLVSVSRYYNQRQSQECRHQIYSPTA